MSNKIDKIKNMSKREKAILKSKEKSKVYYELLNKAINNPTILTVDLTNDLTTDLTTNQSDQQTDNTTIQSVNYISKEKINFAYINKSINKIKTLLEKTKKLIRLQSVDKSVDKYNMKTIKNSRFKDNYLPIVAMKSTVEWISIKEQDFNYCLILTDELIKFYEYAKLTSDEEKARNHVIKQIKTIIKQTFPNTQITCFGSHSLGLSTFLSDIDISIQGLLEDVYIEDDINESLDHENQIDNLLDNQLDSDEDIQLVHQLNSEMGNQIDDDDIANSNENLPWFIDKSADTSILDYLSTNIYPNCFENTINKSTQNLKRKLSEISTNKHKIFNDTSSEESCENVPLDNSFDFSIIDEEIDDNLIGKLDGKLDGKIDNYNGRSTDRKVERYSNGFLSFQGKFMSSRDQEERKNRICKCLSKLYHRKIRRQEWIYFSEFRHKAKVPIIYLKHKNSIECDISIGIRHEDTTQLVQYIQSLTNTELFNTLSIFLKVLLHTYELDKPFTGGIGSFKLYVMLGHLLVDKKIDSSISNYGYVLCLFFQHYGQKRNLNEMTEITLGNHKVDFIRAFKISICQQLFNKCFITLYNDVTIRISRSNIPTDSLLDIKLDSKFDNKLLEKKFDDSNNSHISTSRLSNSYLAKLVDPTVISYNRKLSIDNISNFLKTKSNLESIDQSNENERFDALANTLLNKLKKNDCTIDNDLSIQQIKTLNKEVYDLLVEIALSGLSDKQILNSQVYISNHFEQKRNSKYDISYDSNRLNDNNDNKATSYETTEILTKRQRRNAKENLIDERINEIRNSILPDCKVSRSTRKNIKEIVANKMRSFHRSKNTNKEIDKEVKKLLIKYNKKLDNNHANIDNNVQDDENRNTNNVKHKQSKGNKIKGNFDSNDSINNYQENGQNNQLYNKKVEKRKRSKMENDSDYNSDTDRQISKKHKKLKKY